MLIMHSLLAAALLHSSGIAGVPQVPAGIAQAARFIGHWNLVTYDLQPDGTIVRGRAMSHVYLVLDGLAVQDDFRGLDASGQVVFRGTSLRTVSPRTGQWRIRWVMVNDPGMTDLTASFRNEGREFVGEGRGYDDRGEFLERFTYTFASDDEYVFEMSRSYDGGRTWLERFARIEARRR